MKLRIGDKIKYTFPQAVNGQNKTVEAIVEYVGETFIKVRLHLDIIMNISYKNYDFIELAEERTPA